MKVVKIGRELLGKILAQILYINRLLLLQDQFLLLRLIHGRDALP